MKESEKKAYDYLKKYIKWETFGERNLEGDIKTILKLIDKQQKEIEALKAITKEYEAYNCREDNKIVIASKDYFLNGFFKDFLNDYISKDKIKEKIKLLKDIKKANCYKQLTEDYIKGAIEQLEELLVSGQESEQEGGQEDE